MHDQDVSYIHLRPDSSRTNTNGLTIAYRPITDDKIEYAVAICSSRDNFCRRQGRIKSSGRLNSERYRVVKDMSVPDFRDYVYRMEYDEAYFEL